MTCLAASILASTGARAVAQEAPAAVGAGEASPTPPPAAPEAPRPRSKPFSLGLWGALPTGEHFSTAISPKDAAYQVNEPDRSWSFGLVVDYAVSPTLAVFLDGGLYAQSVQVAKKDGYGTSFWVYEQTGYTTHDVGPFDQDVRYYMDTTALRIGGRWVLPLGSLRAWLGGTFGVYAWQATYGTNDRSGRWGHASGKVTGFTIMMGTDLPLGESVTAGLFADLASPAAEIEMKDLFRDGWTWTDHGHHVMGPYRFGIRLLASL